MRNTQPLRDRPLGNDESSMPDPVKLSVEQLGSVAGGYQIREAAGGGFEVLNDNGNVVFSAPTYGDAWAWCERMGGRR